MAAGTLSGDPDAHLFILDSVLNRIVELKVAPNGATTATTPSATSTSTAGAGGAMAGTSGLSMQLLNQFTSFNTLSSARSLVVDPVSAQNTVYVLGQDSQAAGQHTFLQINVRQKNAACS